MKNIECISISKTLIRIVCTISLFLVTELVNATQNNADKLYGEHCSTCHGVNREGLMGPALLPGNLSRLRVKAALDVITHGRVATQMPAFRNTLDAKQLKSVADYIFQSPSAMPLWSDEMIVSSRKDLEEGNSTGNEPVFEADPWNIFLVVESGDHHVTVLDGDSFEPITRFKSHFALHGGPKFTRDGRFVYFASRDGWVSKYDIYNLKFVAEVRVGINTRNIAVSDDGKYVIAANYWPQSLVILDGTDLSLIQQIDVKSEDGKSSRVSAVYNARPRGSFIVALKDVPELWEIPYNQRLADSFSPKRVIMDAILDDFFFSPDYKHVMGASRPVDSGVSGKISSGQVVDLDLGEKIADLELPGMPHLGSGISWEYNGRQVMATPNLRDGKVSVIDMTNWKTIAQIDTKGPGFFMRSHEKTPYAWIDVFFGPHKDKVHIIDKKSLEIVKTLQPEPGKTAAHLEFTKDGRYALMSILEEKGAIIVYDALTFEEIKRIPMSRPVGKYNIFNKTHLSAGTSH